MERGSWSGESSTWDPNAQLRPLVKVHPETGRKSIFVASHAFAGLLVHGAAQLHGIARVVSVTNGEPGEECILAILGSSPSGGSSGARCCGSC